ncbi:hypothetical protein Mapa_009225 [Marchantia paleacea]|nr:hypothetical protein Mapa_009225 [Marchantia paleacea]
MLSKLVSPESDQTPEDTLTPWHQNIPEHVVPAKHFSGLTTRVLNVYTCCNGVRISVPPLDSILE